MTLERRVIPLKEYQSVELPADEVLFGNKLVLYEEVISKGYLGIQLKKDCLHLAAGNYIGLIPINDQLAIDVTSKVPIAQLTRIVRLANHTPIPLERLTINYQSDPVENPGLTDMLATAFISTMQDLLYRGLIGSYISIEEKTSFPRGRILVGRTMQNDFARGVWHNVHVSRFTRSVSNPPNRFLRYVLWLLAQHYSRVSPKRGIAKLRTSLNTLYLHMGDVDFDPRGAPPAPDRGSFDRVVIEREYYNPPLRLAELIVAHHGVDLRYSREAGVRLPSLLVNLESAFEDYIRWVLSAYNQEADLVMKDGNKLPPIGAAKQLYDERAKPEANPDFVILGGTNSDNHVLIGDIKYKIAGALPSRDDVNQMVTYAVSYGCDRVLIVHAFGGKGQKHLSRVGRVGGSVDVYQFAMDLDSDLLVEEARLWDAVRTLSVA